MGSCENEANDICKLFSRLQPTEADGVFSEVRPTAESILMAAVSQSSCVGRRLPGRPLLSSTASFSESPFYTASSDVMLSPEPRFQSGPDRLEDIRSALQDSQSSAPHHSIISRQAALHLAPGSRALDRRTQSVGDVYAFNSPLPHLQPIGSGYRKLPDVTGWDVAAGSAPESATSQAPQRYKTELCRPFEENGVCRYGAKCQFAHGREELRTVARHPKYKTEMCRTFHTTGYCPYGPRCHFIHNDDVTADQLAPPQHHHHHHQLARQSSTPVTSGAVEQATAAAVHKDIERRRTQLMQLHLHSTSRRRPTMDEISDEVEPSADWYSTANVIDRRQPSYVPATSVPPVGWPPVMSSSSSASPLSSSSSASSPVSSTGAEHLMQYIVDPPPGLPIPPTAAQDVFLRNSQRPTGGSSPTSDIGSSIASFEVSTSSAAPTSVAYQHMMAAHALSGIPSSAGHRNAAGRPLLPATSLPAYYTEDQLPVTSALDRHTAEMASIMTGATPSRFQTEPVSSAAIQQRLLADRDGSPCAANSEVAPWFSNTVGDRRAAFSSVVSSWAKQTIDDGSGGTSFDDGDKVDIQQMMSTLNPNQLAKLLEFVKACTPAAPVAGDVTPAAEVPTLTSSSGAWKYGRSVSVNDPSMVASRPVDGHTWAYRQAMTNSPNFTATLTSNRAAGVCS